MTSLDTLNSITLEFVPAKLPEAVSIKPSSYIVVKPNETASDDDSVVDSTASSSSTAPSSPSETSLSDEETEVEEPMDSAATPVYYTLNEKYDDQGVRTPHRLYKNWREVKRGSSGLINHGVTCYMNSAIQALFHVPAFVHYLRDISSGSVRVPVKSVASDMAALLQKTLSSKKPVFPSKIIRRLHDINCMMSEWNQEDSHEYFMSLIGRIQEDSVPRGQKLNSSLIHDIFGGSVRQRVTCQNCHHVSETTQDIYDLGVSFASKKSLQASPDTNNKQSLKHAISEYFAPESISKSDKLPKSGYECENCKKRTAATKVCQLDEAPEHLVIHIKRFKINGSTNTAVKVKEDMKYAQELDMTKYSVRKSPVRYRLLSVVVHEGRGISSGHYTAYCRQPDDSWTEYDDEMVRTVSEKTALSQGGAYILIYSRLTPNFKAMAGASAPAPKPKIKALKDTNTHQPNGSNGVNGKRASAAEIDAIFAAAPKRSKL